MIGYYFGDTGFVSQNGDSVKIVVPGNTNAVITLKLMYSGSVSVKLGSCSKLILSSLCQFIDSNQNVKYDCVAGEGSVFVHTANIQNSVQSHVAINNKLSNNCNSTLNIIAAHCKNAWLDVRSELCIKTSNKLNLLVLPENGSSINANLTHAHAGFSSLSQIDCAGIVDGASCKIDSMISVKEHARDAISSFRCRLININNSNISVVPALSIHNRDSDVKHDVSVQDIKDDALSYIQSRGVPRHEAAELFKNGVVQRMINKMGDAFGY